MTDGEKLNQLCTDVAVISAAIAPEGKVEHGQFVTKLACERQRGKPYRRAVWMILGAIVVAVVTGWVSAHINGNATAAELAQLRAEVVKTNGSK